jgi:glutamate-1-semialdehyde 2,1-aminomutase
MELISLAAYGAGTAIVAISLVKVKRLLELSRAKHRSLTGHARLARRIASLIPFYEYDEHRFFRSDDLRRISRSNGRRAFSASRPSIGHGLHGPAP